MSTIVPNCTITYPKDLSRLYLTINAIELPDLSNACPSDITLTITKDSVSTLISGTTVFNGVLPSSTMTGTISKTQGSLTIIGNGTAFLTDVKIGDVIQVQSQYDKYIIVDSIQSDTQLTSNSPMFFTETLIDCGIIRPTLEFVASDLFTGATILQDGLYEIYFTYDYGFYTATNVIPFSKYVFANQYNCVESKLMNLALYCSEDCVDINTLKYTLLLKALLDSMEVILSEDVVDTTALGIVKEKIDRYCLLLNNNCTNC